MIVVFGMNGALDIRGELFAVRGVARAHQGFGVGGFLVASVIRGAAVGVWETGAAGTIARVGHYAAEDSRAVSCLASVEWVE